MAHVSPAQERAAATDLERAFNHLALPPQLPGSQDDDSVNRLHQNLLTRFIEATTFVSRHIPPSPVVETHGLIIKSLTLTRRLYVDATPSLADLNQALDQLKNGLSLVQYLPAQNATVLIWSPKR